MIVQRHAILLAALLQVLPVVRTWFANPATGSTFAFILSWGVGATAAVGAVDAVSGATTAYFTSASKFNGTVGVPFTNNITMANTKSDGNSQALITTNSVSAILTAFGQSTNFAMPPGLILQFLDDAYLVSPVYDALYGVPTTAGTNTFIISMIYQGVIISTNITITILPGTNPGPVITNQPASVTNFVGTNPSFNVTAGPSPLAFRWFFNTNPLVPNATNSILTLTNVQISQAGYYVVVVSNASGAVTSSPARLTVWQPPAISAPAAPAGSALFQFTLTPVPGVTNTVQTCGDLATEPWQTLTNIPPPATTNGISIFDKVNGSKQFYRIRIVP
jgi:hypothetical protein